MKLTSAFATVFLFLTVPLLQAQGPLTPPGAPGPTMKSLDQIEARTAIPKSPAVPVAGPHYSISQPGSYYLTGNVEVVSGNGININSSNVTLDLNGFALISRTANPAAGNAINISGSYTGIEIKNGRLSGGTVRTYTGPDPWDATFSKLGWDSGIRGDFANSVLVSHLTVERCGGNGIRLPVAKGVMDHVTALGNGSSGIWANECSVSDAAANNNGGAGITVSFGGVSGAIASGNGGYGIAAFKGCVTNSRAANNGTSGIYASYGTVSGSTVSDNGDDGILALYGSVSNCHASDNFKSGISVGFGVAAHCIASGNSTDPATTDKQIDVAAGGGQRIGCYPASE